MEAEGQVVQRDAFGHVKLDSINPGKYLADALSTLIGAEKTLVQKSGYFARAAPANEADRQLIIASAQAAVAHAMLRTASGVVALDEDQSDPWRLQLIDFQRIKGGKPFDVSTPWFVDMAAAIGQTVVAADK